MTIRHLRILAAVCEYGSITVAAEKLYMTQPAVSLAIKELEEHYGVKLFDRLQDVFKLRRMEGECWTMPSSGSRSLTKWSRL
jgi:DNA-binding transcriptional LysR family regulator